MYYNTRAGHQNATVSKKQAEDPPQTTAEYEEIKENIPTGATMTSSVTPAVYDEVRDIGRSDVTSSEYEGLQNVRDNDYLQPYQTITS